MASLYLHIPFCEHKCIYCDFYSIERLGGIQNFVDALLREIEIQPEFLKQESYETIFFGGGTPSLLTPVQLDAILSKVYETFSVDHGVEITVETNPGTVDGGKLSDYKALGVNRLSVGIQSFHEDDLRFLTRIHSSSQAKECVWTARRAGFDNIGIDMIFSLPGQTRERWEANLRHAIGLEPQHISAYSLIVERNTPLARMVAAKQVATLPTEQDADLFEFTMDFLARAGYEHYEVSNYALPGFRSIHNSNYWNHSNYLGLGPSAHSFRMSGKAPARRWWNVANLSTYLENISKRRIPVAGEEILSGSELVEEAIMLGLRSGGIDPSGFQDRFQLDVEDLAGEVIESFVTDGLMKRVEGRLRLTDRGFLLCDAIAESLLAAVEGAKEAA
jgi:oxygen-independent coproporphyrinogen-3 oxidase